MMYRAAIFDLDGTLLDTLADLADACNRTLVALGYPEHEEEAYRYFVGDGLRSLVTRILPTGHRDVPTIERAVELFSEDYGANWAVRTATYPGIDRMLSSLIALDIPMAILSNKPDAFTQLCVQRYFADATFTAVLGQRDEVAKKPDPAGALELAATMALEPSAILYVGDTDTDMQTAVAAGMDGAGVLWGFRGAEELHDNGARHLIQTPMDLVALFSNQRVASPQG